MGLGILLLALAGLTWGIQAFADSARPVNVLIMGVDKDRTRTDVVVVARWHPQDKVLSVISLPRDLKVDIPCPAAAKSCKSPDKLAHAHAYGTVKGGPGGPELARRTVEQFLGIQIQHYVRLDFDGFKAVVDALGGVTIDVERNMDYEDPYQNLRIHLKKGEQTLNGEKALQYVRFRGDRQGDIGRIDRTQKFLVALLQSARANGSLSRLPALVQALLPAVDTNLDAGAAIALARAAQQITPEAVETATIPGKARWDNGAWFWVADAEGTRELVDTMLKDPQTAALLWRQVASR